MTTRPASLTIGRLAKRAGVGIDTVRFYERSGLLPTPARTASGYRTYTAGDVDRLRFIRRSKELGFTLEEVTDLLDLAKDGKDRAAVKAIAARRLASLEERIQQLTAVRNALAKHANACSGHGPVQGCPIIQAVLSPTATQES